MVLIMYKGMDQPGGLKVNYGIAICFCDNANLRPGSILASLASSCVAPDNMPTHRQHSYVLLSHARPRAQIDNTVLALAN